MNTAHANMKNSPTVSVVLPVHNGERYLDDAIKSILSQTYEDFEFIIINDGSTDNTQCIIEKYAERDSRIHIISRENKGLVYSLNEGIIKSTGKYIARMDADDISLPHRFMHQIDYFERNSDVVVLGVWTFSDKMMKLRSRGVTGKKESTWSLLFNNKIGHPGVMFRAYLFRERGLRYRQNYLYAEDFKLWSQMIAYGYANILPERLLYYRKHNESVSQVNFLAQQSICRKILIENLKDRLSLDMSDCDESPPAAWATTLATRVFNSAGYKGLDTEDKKAIHRAYQDYSPVFGLFAAVTYLRNSGFEAIKYGGFMLISYAWRTAKHQVLRRENGYFLNRIP